MDLLPENGPVSLDLTYSSEGGMKRLQWVVQEELLHQSLVGDFILQEEGDILIGSDQVVPGLPLLWFNVGVSEAYDDTAVETAGNPDSGAPALNHSADPFVSDNSEGTLEASVSVESELLYERQDSALSEILIEDILLDSSLFTMEIVLDKDGVGKDWVFSLYDENGLPFYTFDSISFQDDGNPDESGFGDMESERVSKILTLSFVSDKGRVVYQQR